MPRRKATRQHKALLFRHIFGSEKHRDITLYLYNAVNHSHYTDSSQIQIVTLDDVLYVAMKNDIGFLIGNELNMYEQQSSWNPNMPLRMLFYAAEELGQYADEHNINLYTSALKKIPAPKCVVFYNGETEQPEKSELLLSQMFENGTQGDIEVRVTVYNINRNSSKTLKGRCKPLDEYCWFIDRVNELKLDMGLDRAVSKAIDEMPDDFIIAQLIKPEKAKVTKMLRTEYDRKAFAKSVYDEGKAEGLAQGIAQGKVEGIAQGKAEGEQNRATKIALLMIKDKEDPVRIQRYTNLSIEQIKKLMQGSKNSD